MTLYITEVQYGWFKKSLTTLTILENWSGEALPVKDDILHIKDDRFIILQRDFLFQNAINLYVRRL